MISAHDVIEAALQSTDFYQFRIKCTALRDRDTEQDD